MPWPIRFGFVKVVEDDGTQRWACASVDIGGPITRDQAGLDSSAFELTAERIRYLGQNLDRLRKMAERRLIPTVENLEHARRMRRGMKRKPREPWTAETLAILVNEYRALQGDPDGRMWTLSDRYGIDRSNVHRALKRAAREGRIELDELNPRKRNT